jgi:hypothetical protein
LKKLLKTSEFDYKYFIAPIRGLVPRPNPISLYMTQYMLEDVMNDPCVIDVFGTEEEIYKAVNRVISNINLKFERAEEKIMQQLSNNKSLSPVRGNMTLHLKSSSERQWVIPRVEASLNNVQNLLFIDVTSVNIKGLIF